MATFQPSESASHRSAAVVMLAAAGLLGCDLSVDPSTLGGGGASAGGGDAAGGAGGAQCTPVAPQCPDGGSGVLISLLEGATLNGQMIDPGDPTITVTADSQLSGTIGLRVSNDYSPTDIVPLMYTPTWGEHQNVAVLIAGNVTEPSYQVSLAGLAAPAVAGTYHLLFAAAAQCSHCHIASAVFWRSCAAQPSCNACGCVDLSCDGACMRWNDGNDLADLEEEDLCSVLERGYLNMNTWDPPDGRCATLGLTYIRLVVEP